MGGAAGGPGPRHRGCRALPRRSPLPWHSPVPRALSSPEPSYGAMVGALLGAWWELQEEGLASCRLGCPLHLALSLPALLGLRPLGQVEGGAGAGHSLCLPPLQETSQSGFSRGGPWPFRSWCFPASCRSHSGPQLLLVFFTVTRMELTKGPWWVGRRRCPHPGVIEVPHQLAQGQGRGQPSPSLQQVGSGQRRPG